MIFYISTLWNKPILKSTLINALTYYLCCISHPPQPVCAIPLVCSYANCVWNLKIYGEERLLKNFFMVIKHVHLSGLKPTLHCNLHSSRVGACPFLAFGHNHLSALSGRTSSPMSQKSGPRFCPSAK